MAERGSWVIASDTTGFLGCVDGHGSRCILMQIGAADQTLLSQQQRDPLDLIYLFRCWRRWVWDRLDSDVVLAIVSCCFHVICVETFGQDTVVGR